MFRSLFIDLQKQPFFAFPCSLEIRAKTFSSFRFLKICNHFFRTHNSDRIMTKTRFYVCEKDFKRLSFFGFGLDTHLISLFW